MLQSFRSPVLEDDFLQVSRPGVAKQESYTSPSLVVNEPEILECSNFEKIDAAEGFRSLNS